MGKRKLDFASLFGKSHILPGKLTAKEQEDGPNGQRPH
jgi:hypothetical protein